MSEIPFVTDMICNSQLMPLTCTTINSVCYYCYLNNKWNSNDFGALRITCVTKLSLLLEYLLKTKQNKTKTKKSQCAIQLLSIVA